MVGVLFSLCTAIELGVVDAPALAGMVKEVAPALAGMVEEVEFAVRSVLMVNVADLT